MAASRLAALALLVSACGSTKPSSDAGTSAPRPTPDASHLTDAAHAPDARDATPVAAVPLPPELGFVDVPAQETAATYPARMFYAFRPADDASSPKPLLVFYDGGPGAATSANLLVYGTGPMTLDPVTGVPGPNPASFTRFANLLYLDERQTGFSYGLDSPGPDAGGCTFSALEDAAEFIRAIGAFLGAHPSLSTAKVVLVGESYGGTRSTAILYLAESASDMSVSMPGDVRQTLHDHAAQFGQAVLIQPLMTADQYAAQQVLIPQDPYLANAVICAGGGDGGACPDGAVDNYDVQKPAGWSDGLENRAGVALGNAAQSSALLGADLGTVTDLLPAARANAFRLPGAEVGPAESSFVAQFGPLSTGDTYWTADDPTCPSYNPTMDGASDAWIYQVLLQSRLFITNARYDDVIYTPAIPYVLSTEGMTPASIDTSPRAGVARPGWIHVSIPTDAGTNDIEIRFPTYVSSGHMVAVTQAADLADDIEAWLAEAP